MPGNARCADCSTTPVTHVALDFGVFLCAGCALVHTEPETFPTAKTIKPVIHARQVTPYDAIVSSNDLLLLRALGNTAANAKLEARLQAGPVTCMQALKPTCASHREARRTFIRAKYEDADYALHVPQVRTYPLVRVRVKFTVKNAV